MNARQQRFVEEYLVDLCATQAAIRAGYSKRTAEQQGYRLLRNVEIQGVVQKWRDEQSERATGSREWVIEQLIDTVERCKQAVPMLDKDGEATGVWRFDPNPAVRALELLGRRYGLFDEKVKVDQTVRERSPNAKDENLALIEKARAAGKAV